MILNNGTYRGVKILEPWTVDLIFQNYDEQCASLAVLVVLPAGSGEGVDKTQSPSTLRGWGSSSIARLGQDQCDPPRQLGNQVSPVRLWSSIAVSVPIRLATG
jgi:hypothetical protein